MLPGLESWLHALIQDSVLRPFVLPDKWVPWPAFFKLPPTRQKYSLYLAPPRLHITLRPSCVAAAAGMGSMHSRAQQERYGLHA